MITLVGCPEGDWEGIYRDGTLLDEGHSLPAWRVLEALGLEREEIEADLSEWGRCPTLLSELVLH